jgi:hypothetical protein
MKKVTLPLVLLSLFMFGACQSSEGDSGSAGNTGNPGDPGTGVVNKSIKLNDANGNFIGYVVSADSSQLYIYTDKNYLVNLLWNGTFSGDTVYYVDPQGDGLPFVALEDDAGCYYAKTVVLANGKYLVPRDVDVNGYATSDASITSYKSFASKSGGIIDYDGNLLGNSVAIVLVETTRAAVGLPATITLPLKLVFE